MGISRSAAGIAVLGAAPFSCPGIWGQGGCSRHQKPQKQDKATPLSPVGPGMRLQESQLPPKPSLPLLQNSRKSTNSPRFSLAIPSHSAPEGSELIPSSAQAQLRLSRCSWHHVSAPATPEGTAVASPCPQQGTLLSSHCPAGTLQLWGQYFTLNRQICPFWKKIPGILQF